MSGGSFNYLYSRVGCSHEYERAADALRADGFADAADAVATLAATLHKAETLAAEQAAKLEAVLHALEFFHSGDYDRSDLESVIAQWAMQKD